MFQKTSEENQTNFLEIKFDAKNIFLELDWFLFPKMLNVVEIIEIFF